MWTWVPYEEDASQGKDRPVLVLARSGDRLIVAQMTSKDHDRDAAQEASHGRYWFDVGPGPGTRGAARARSGSTASSPSSPPPSAARGPRWGGGPSTPSSPRCASTGADERGEARRRSATHLTPPAHPRRAPECAVLLECVPGPLAWPASGSGDRASPGASTTFSRPWREPSFRPMTI
ncbi:hypothetical protein [Actinomyces denticolens]|uniref:hypothetical protein n=1 Tax=Actinomyces denticolens TaxID=52767 RepID=UPI003530B81F